MYIYAPKGQIEKFPYSIDQLRREKNISVRRDAGDDRLASLGIYPVEVQRPTPFQRQSKTPVFENGKWILRAEDKDIKHIQAELRARVNKIRYSKIYQESISYTFPGDTEPDGIQMRDERDRQNVQDHILESVVLLSEGSTDTLTFMPVSNTPKSMTPAQGVQMGKFLKARGNRIMEHSWMLKAQIRAARSVEEIKQIDIQTGWPE